MMANSRRYKRYFIVLENEDRGFENNTENLPKGYAKIEVRNGKGLLNIYVQDLKYFKDAEYIYRSYLVSATGNESAYVDVGSLMIDEKGKVEHKWKLDPDNVEGSGKSLEDFNVIAIVAEPIDKSRRDKKFSCPLVGFFKKEKIDWKSMFSEVKSEKEKSGNEDYGEKENKQVKEIKGKEKEEAKVKPKEELKKEAEVKPKKEMKEELKAEVKEEVKPKQKAEVKEEVKEEAKIKPKIEEEEIEEVEPDEEVELNDEYEEKYKKIMGVIEESSKELYQENKYEEGIQEEYNELEDDEIAGNIQGLTENVESEHEKEDEGPIEEAEADYDNEIPDEVADIDEKDNSNKHQEKTQSMEHTEYNNLKENLQKQKEQSSNSYNEEYYKRVHKYVNDMLKNSESVKPFEKDIENCSWWKMNYSQQNMHKGFLPFFGYILNIYYYNPYIFYMNNCDNLMDKYGHYIFGITYDDKNLPKYYIYGIPGRYLYKEQPFRGMTGFVYWHPLEDNEKPKKGDYGYWLLHIDSKTGNVAFPLKPTIPPMY